MLPEKKITDSKNHLIFSNKFSPNTSAENFSDGFGAFCVGIDFLNIGMAFNLVQ